MRETYDAIVIGTGQAGPSLAVRVAAAGRRVAVIERHKVGGTCVNVGCVPTKALMASARGAHPPHRLRAPAHHPATPRAARSRWIVSPPRCVSAEEGPKDVVLGSSI